MDGVFWDTQQRCNLRPAVFMDIIQTHHISVQVRQAVYGPEQPLIALGAEYRVLHSVLPRQIWLLPDILPGAGLFPALAVDVYGTASNNNNEKTPLDRKSVV